MFNGASGSVRQYFREMSGGQLDIQSTVTQWVKLPHNEKVYGSPDGEPHLAGEDGPRMARDAVLALEAAGFDFAPLDGNGD